MNTEVTNYIIQFMLGGNLLPQQRMDRLIGYTSDKSEMQRYRVVIRPSSFFRTGCYGTEAAYPTLPLEEWEGVPVLFGKPGVSRESDGGPLIIEADLVASTFFLISRYEEMYKREIRDEHGRFPGKESLPYRAGFIHRPIVDEYGVLLRKILRNEGTDIPEPPFGFSHINLTHDVDEPFEYRGWRGMMRAIIKEKKSPFKAFHLAFRPPWQDRYYTFAGILERNKELRDRLGEEICDTIFFFKSMGTHPLDAPCYNLGSACFTPLTDLCNKREVRYGLHCSYASGLDPDKILREKEHLQKTCSHSIDISRHHYLSAREPEDMQALISAGIRHDYTMGYADVAGFRLGTCRVVRFIRPCTRVLTELLLHPLTVMDCTLNRPNYMGLEYSEAKSYTFGLIEQTALHHGELNLLWHNVSFAVGEQKWLDNLYRDIIRETMNIHIHGKKE